MQIQKGFLQETGNIITWSLVLGGFSIKTFLQKPYEYPNIKYYYSVLNDMALSNQL